MTSTAAPPASGPPAPGPTKVIEAGRSRRAFVPSRIWDYRDLLYFLTRRHVVARYRQTAFGILWAVFQPFVTMVVFSFFLGQLAGVPSDGAPYPVFAYLGIVPWAYFSATVSRGAISLLVDASLLSNVYFPRALIPLSSTLAGLVDYVIALILLFVIMAFYGIAPSLSALWIIPLTFALGAIATGIGMGLAALNVTYRDVGFALPFLMQIWLFATPVVYPISVVPKAYQAMYALNPAAGIIAAYRDCVLGRPVDATTLGVSLVSGFAFMLLGAWQFGRLERRFADTI